MPLSRILVVLLLPLLAAACAGTPRGVAPSDPGEEVYLTVDGPVVSSRSQMHRLDTVRLLPGDMADAGTTGAGLAAGATEMNPVLSWAGPAAPILAMPLKFGAKKALVNKGMTNAQANVAVSTGSALGACANLATLAGVHPVAALVTGTVCAMAYNGAARRDYERNTGRHLNGAAIEG